MLKFIPNKGIMGSNGGVENEINTLSKNKKSMNLIISKINEKTKEGNEIYLDILFSVFKKSMIKEISKVEKFFQPKLKEKDFKDNVRKNGNTLVEFLKELNENENENKTLYRLFSSIYGAFFGDAAGAYCEFKKPSEYNHELIFTGNNVFDSEECQVTDDSEMAMSMAYAIMTMPKKNEMSSLYSYYFYGYWLASHPIDVGIATRNALNNFLSSKWYTVIPEEQKNLETLLQSIEETNSGSKANGFLMRISPFIAWFYMRYEDLVTKAFEANDINDMLRVYLTIRTQAGYDICCTHPNKECASAAGIFCLMALGVILGISSDNVVEFIKKFAETVIKESQSYIKEEDLDVCKNYLGYVYKFKNLTREQGKSFFLYEESIYKHMGYYLHAFKLTIWYLTKFSSIYYNLGYMEILREICDLGGDTDTNAAIVGAVIGPLFGYKTFNNDYFYKMVSLIPDKREIYSPCFMVLYMDFLVKSKREKKEDLSGHNTFISMYLQLTHSLIDKQTLCK